MARECTGPEGERGGRNEGKRVGGKGCGLPKDIAEEKIAAFCQGCGKKSQRFRVFKIAAFSGY